MDDINAFPIASTEYCKKTIRSVQGMTLRDYFAAKAMQSRLDAAYDLTGDQVVCDAKIAAEAYRVADSMMKQRDKK